MVIRYDELLDVIQRRLAEQAQALLPDYEFVLRPRAEEAL